MSKLITEVKMPIDRRMLLRAIDALDEALFYLEAIIGKQGFAESTTCTTLMKEWKKINAYLNKPIKGKP